MTECPLCAHAMSYCRYDNHQGDWVFLNCPKCGVQTPGFSDKKSCRSVVAKWANRLSERDTVVKLAEHYIKTGFKINCSQCEKEMRDILEENF